MKSSIVIVDIDGTISKVGDRLKYLKQTPVDWDSFYNSCFEDEPIIEICDLVQELDSIYTIYFCTGRRESVREQTIDWIKKNVENSWSKDWINTHLIMRPNGDKRHDTEVKPEQLFKSNGVCLENIAFVLEDRDSMVKKWRDLGIKCLQVAEGDF